MFPPPPPPAEPSSIYWQLDDPPWTIVRMPDTAVSFLGHHVVAPIEGARWLARQDRGEAIPCVTSPGGTEAGARAPTAASPGQIPLTGRMAPIGPAPHTPAATPFVALPPFPALAASPPPDSDRRAARRIHPPRAPRFPRPPRVPRAGRPSRDPRPPRGPRQGRFPRKPRRPRVPRPPRRPRKPGYRQPAEERYCIYDAQGNNRLLLGGGLLIRPGETLPPLTEPGYFYALNTTGMACTNNPCTGPLAGLLGQIAGLIFGEHGPAIPPELIADAQARSARTQRRLLRIAAYVPMGGPERDPYGGSNYCCRCGEVGLCWTSGADCRLMAVKQARYGQCV